MVKRNGRRQSNRRIPSRRMYDPWVDIAVQATNRFVNFGTDYLLDLAQKKLGINKHSMKTEIEQNRVLCALEKSKAEAALARQREAEALEKAEEALEIIGDPDDKEVMDLLHKGSMFRTIGLMKAKKRQWK